MAKEKGLTQWPSPLFEIGYKEKSGRVNVLPDVLRTFLFGYHLGGLWTFLAHTFFKFYRLALC